MRHYLIDIASLLIILSILFGFWWRSDFLKIMFEDFSYHLLVAQNYHQSGGIVTWDNWESAPNGRPQNYPPLWQFFISLFVNIPWSSNAAVIFFNLLAIGICLSLSWLGIRLLYNDLAGLFFLLLVTAFHRYIMFLGVVVPASLVLAATPLLIYLVREKRWRGASALFTLMLYTHMIYPWLVLSTVILWQVWVHKKQFPWKQLAGAFGMAIILYLPWGLRVLNNINYIKYTNTNYQNLGLVPDYYINFSILLISSWALIYLSLKKFVWKEKVADYFPWVTFALIQLPIIYSLHPSRYTISGGALMLMILGGIALSELWRQRQNQAIWRKYIIVLLIISNVCFVELASRQTSGIQIFSLKPALFFTLLSYDRDDPQTTLMVKDVFTVEADRLAQVIKSNSAPTEVIMNVTDLFNLEIYPYYKTYVPAQFLGALAGRPIANPRNPELYWLAPFPINRARLVIADLRQTRYYDGKVSEDNKKIAEALEKDFVLVGQEDRIMIFKNKAANTFNITPQKTFLPNWLALVLLISALMIIAREVAISRRLN